jgi:hypothetical protein
VASVPLMIARSTEGHRACRRPRVAHIGAPAADPAKPKLLEVRQTGARSPAGGGALAVLGRAAVPTFTEFPSGHLH